MSSRCLCRFRAVVAVLFMAEDEIGKGTRKSNDLKEKIEPFDFEYRFNKAKHAWNNCYKIAIRHLLDTDRAYDNFAMLGLLVCMEEAFRLKTFHETGKQTSDSGEMLKMYFGDDIHNRHLNVVKIHFVNAIRHQSTLDSWGSFNLENDGRDEVLQHWNVMHITDGVHRSSFIEIYPIVIWNRCAPQIDAFYNNYELDEDQLPASYGGVVKMWITPSKEGLLDRVQH